MNMVSSFRDALIGGVGGVLPPLFSKLQESWSKASHDVREMATVLPMILFFNNSSCSNVQNAPPPPMESALTHL